MHACVCRRAGEPRQQAGSGSITALGLKLTCARRLARMPAAAAQEVIRGIQQNVKQQPTSEHPGQSYWMSALGRQEILLRQVSRL